LRNISFNSNQIQLINQTPIHSY